MRKECFIQDITAPRNGARTAQSVWRSGLRALVYPIASGARRNLGSGKLIAMNSCSKCVGFSQRLTIDTPSEYREIVRQLIELVEHGTFLLTRADCPLEGILRPSWPDDIVVHEFQCFVCGRKFMLSADTYHGNAGWTPGPVPEPKRNPPRPN